MRTLCLISVHFSAVDQVNIFHDNDDNMNEDDDDNINVNADEDNYDGRDKVNSYAI